MRDLVVHLAGFAAALRARGVAVGMAEEADALAALPRLDVGDRDEVERGLGIAMRIRPRDLEVFRELFAALWRAAPEPQRVGRSRRPSVRNPTGPAPATRGVRRPTEPGGGPGKAGDQPGWSPEAALRRKPFEELPEREVVAMERLLARLAARLATRPSRRLVPSPRGRVDLRRSLRDLLGTAGEPVRLARRDREARRLRLVVLCDTSGSMDPHTRFLLAFVLALRRVARSTEVFAFGTALVRLTPWLGSGADLRRTLERVAGAVDDWSGGTRIGVCLADFAARWLESTVDTRTVVLVFSDGLDRGDVAPLAGAMRALRRRARRVLWLNPLAGDPRYEPTARAMAAALPFVDRLLPAHDYRSLERLLPLLVA